MNCFSLGAHPPFRTNFLRYTSIQQCLVSWFFIISFIFWSFETSACYLIYCWMFQVLVDVYVDPELLVAYGMISFLFVSWYLLFPVWLIILASFDAHVNLEVCSLFSLLPEGQCTRTIPLSINKMIRTSPANWRKGIFVPIYAFEDLNLTLPDKTIHLLTVDNFICLKWTFIILWVKGCMEIETG